MKRTVFAITLLFAVFLMLLGSIHQSQAKQIEKAQSLENQGFYDEALQAYAQAKTHHLVFRSAMHLFGEFNAFLAVLGFLSIFCGIFLKKPQPQRCQTIKFTRYFRS